MTPAQAPIALTMGDPAGIGPEIAVRAWSRGTAPPFFLIADPDHLSTVAGPVPLVEIADPADTADAFARGLPVLREALFTAPVPGRPEGRNAAAVVRSIDRAVSLVGSGAAAAVVTNPISKKVLKDGAGFAFPGHTEYLGALGNAPLPVMMIAGPSLRVVPVTIHVPLAAVPGALTRDLILGTARVTAEGLRHDFAIDRPRLALTGLNPHAGEGGAMGREEIEVIAPAIEVLRAEGIAASGPHPADALFHARAREGYDVVLTMYHDQGLIPVKTLDFDQGVNVTLGLPFIRTSPDHGTAFDIAGTGRARPDSLLAALAMAADIARLRARGA